MNDINKSREEKMKAGKVRKDKCIKIYNKYS